MGALAAAGGAAGATVLANRKHDEELVQWALVSKESEAQLAEQAQQQLQVGLQLCAAGAQLP